MIAVIIILEIIIIALLVYFVRWFLDVWGKMSHEFGEIENTFNKIDYTITEINNVIQDYWNTKNGDD